MNCIDKDGASDADEPSQSSVTGRNKDGLPTGLEKKKSRRESAVIDDQATVPSRENLASPRDNAARLREDAVEVREEAATTREGEIGAAEALQVTADGQMARLQQANTNLVVATIEAYSLTEQLQSAKAALDHLAHYDFLTGLPNRSLLKDRLVQAIALAHRQGKQLALMFMDLDQFKHVNDSLGHLAGDQLLQSVAQRLVGCVRQSDTVSRRGGDEFVLMLPNIEQAEDVALSAQKMLAAIALPHSIEGQECHIGVSIGISIYPDDGRDAATLIKNADIAMYHAKLSGRNNYQFFEQEMNARAVMRQSIEAGLRHALERQELLLHYQPKIDLHRGTIVGIEALLRWQHPQRGLLEPAQFVPVAEDSGLTLPIGRWVLREACRQARAWQDAGLPAIPVAVNISALEFRASDFLEHLRATVEDTGLEPRYLELEVTENVLMRDTKSTDSVLRALADLGVKLAIDDFGTGCSSLSYLRKFPNNTLKIDQSFVNQITSNPDDALFVSAMISMGKSLKLRVIAEGVETAEQVAFLLSRHCDEGQGHFFSPPVAAEAFGALLHTGVSLTLPH